MPAIDRRTILSRGRFLRRASDGRAASRLVLSSACALLLTLAVYGCTETNEVLTVSAPSLFVAQAGGVWVGTLAPTASVARFDRPTTGPACLDEDLIDAVGQAARASLTINQTGTTLAARMTAETVGLSCNYAGNAGLTTMTLDASACDATGLQVQCASGAVLSLSLVGSSILANVRADNVTGTATSTYNVAGRGSFVVSSNLAAVRQ